MDLVKSGKLLCNLRKANGMTQRQVAERLGILPKTVSKWETGNGFPDVSILSSLAEILGVSEKTILSGDLKTNKAEPGNMKKTKFYVCPCCGSVVQGTGNSRILCCGKQVEAMKAVSEEDEHTISISEIENEYYIEFEHEMTKEHYIEFISYVGFDRVLTVRLYPEQASAVRFPKMYGGSIFYYCSKHGLFEHRMPLCRKNTKN